MSMFLCALGSVLLGVGTGLGLGIAPSLPCSSSSRCRMRRTLGERALEESAEEPPPPRAEEVMCCEESEREGIDEPDGLEPSVCLSRVDVRPGRE